MVADFNLRPFTGGGFLILYQGTDHIYSRKERLKNWDLILPLCEKMALATKEDEFIKAVNALYETYMVTHDPENPFPVLF